MDRVHLVVRVSGVGDQHREDILTGFRSAYRALSRLSVLRDEEERRQVLGAELRRATAPLRDKLQEADPRDRRPLASALELAENSWLEARGITDPEEWRAIRFPDEDVAYQILAVGIED